MDTTQRQREALEDWKYAQHLSQCVPLAHRSVVGPIASTLGRVPILGSIIRSVQRIRYLGALSERQLLLNEMSFEQAQCFGHYMTSVNEVLVRTQSELTELKDLLKNGYAPLEERLLSLHEVALTGATEAKSVEARLNMEVTRLQMNLEVASAEVQAVAARNESFAERADFLEQALRMNTSHLRVLEQQHRPEVQPDEESKARDLLTPDRLVELLERLESEVPELAEATGIGLSIQDQSAEEALLAAVSYLGDRLAQTPEAIVSSTVWYHVDLTNSWQRPDFLEGAVRKLALGGLLVVVTNPDDEVLPVSSELLLTLDRVLEVGISSVRVYMWRLNVQISDVQKHSRERVGA